MVKGLTATVSDLVYDCVLVVETYTDSALEALKLLRDEVNRRIKAEESDGQTL